MNTLRKFFSLTKYRIVLGNLFPLFAGYCLHGGGSFLNLISTTIFAWLVISCGCVFNNCYDVDIDALMERTKNRVLPTKELSVQSAFFFGIIILLVSIIYGFLFVNEVTIVIAYIGLFCYAVLYTVFTKRDSNFGIHIGAIAGAAPVLIGYTGIDGTLQTPAIILFLALIVWQIPHSFAIEIYRFEDYQNAKIKTIPSNKGIKWTKISNIIYITLFGLLNIVLFPFTNPLHWVISTAMFLLWMFHSAQGFKLGNTVNESRAWARKSFIYSILNMVLISFTISLNCLF